MILMMMAILLQGCRNEDATATAEMPPPFAIIDTSEVSIAEGPIPCRQGADDLDYICEVYKAVVDADDPETTLDDPLQSTHVLLVVRKKKDIPWDHRWITFHSGGHGRGYGLNFGGVAPGAYIPGGDGYGDDLIRWYNELGYVTVDVIWECPEEVGERCYDTPFAGWVPEYDNGTGWFRNTRGAGYVGVGSRTKAIVNWVLANNGGQRVCSHGHSSGSGRLITALTRYRAESSFDTVVFDGGPVFAYIPWYCGITDDGDPGNGFTTPGPLGPKPAEYDIEAYNIKLSDNYDNARDPNNGEGETRYLNCSNHVWHEVAMMADSNFYKTAERDFSTVDLAVVLGGDDTTLASIHARLWFQGYTYETESISALSAKSLLIRQGYCSNFTDQNATYEANSNTYPCTDWDPIQFPMANAVDYLPDLAKVQHPTARSLEGATVLFNTMQLTCELEPFP